MSSASSDEEWRSVPGYEGAYEASSRGRIRSVDRIIVSASGSQRLLRGKVLSGRPDIDGYLEVGLYRRGIQKTVKVHRIVCSTFHGKPDEGQIVLHYDDNPGNNGAENLRWGTASDNMFDMVRNGNHHEVNRKECPRGHLLDGNNLVPSQSVRGGRSCLACARARCRVNYHKKKGRYLNLQDESDYEYEKIVRGEEVA